eukprot:scaffold108940_cov38-Tisochrysis_lutea.AAC.3
MGLLAAVHACESRSTPASRVPRLRVAFAITHQTCGQGAARQTCAVAGGNRGSCPSRPAA